MSPDQKRLIAPAVLTALWLAAPAQAELNVFACEPEWASLAMELGGDKVNAASAVTGRQDVHYIQARPSLISKLRKADLLICTGADLEVGWLPVLLRQAGNPAVHPGGPGFLEASAYAQLLEIPGNVDRAGGDVHPYGNPHIQTDPRNIARVARALATRLAELDPENGALYAARHDDFQTRWRDAMARWSERAAPLEGMHIVMHHRSWVYLIDWLGLVEIGALEPKPGIPPTTGHLKQLLSQMNGKDVRLAIRATYQPSRASHWLAGRTDISVSVLPHTVGSVNGAEDLFGLFDVIIDRLLNPAE